MRACCSRPTRSTRSSRSDSDPEPEPEECCDGNDEGDRYIDQIVKLTKKNKKEGIQSGYEWMAESDPEDIRKYLIGRDLGFRTFYYSLKTTSNKKESRKSKKRDSQKRAKQRRDSQRQIKGEPITDVDALD